MEEKLEVGHALHHCFWRRGNECRTTGPAAADPVLAASKFTRVLVAAEVISQQHAVHFSEQPERQRQSLFQKTHAMIEGRDIVADLAYVIKRYPWFLIQLIQQQVRQRSFLEEQNA